MGENLGQGQSGSEDTVVSEPNAFDRILASLHDAMLDDSHWSATSALIDDVCRAKGRRARKTRLSCTETAVRIAPHPLVPPTHVHNVLVAVRALAVLVGPTRVRVQLRPLGRRPVIGRFPPTHAGRDVWARHRHRIAWPVRSLGQAYYRRRSPWATLSLGVPQGWWTPLSLKLRFAQKPRG